MHLKWVIYKKQQMFGQHDNVKYTLWQRETYVYTVSQHYKTVHDIVYDHLKWSQDECMRMAKYRVQLRVNQNWNLEQMGRLTDVKNLRPN